MATVPATISKMPSRSNTHQNCLTRWASWANAALSGPIVGGVSELKVLVPSSGCGKV